MAVADTLNTWGIQRGYEVVDIAAQEGLALHIAAAVLEQESGGGFNVWGNDGVPTGNFYVKGAPATKESYLAWKPHRSQLGSQGIGPMQLTYAGFQDQADALGGAYDWASNVRIGFRTLANLIRSYGQLEGIRRYNGSGPQAEAYKAQVMVKAAKWADRIGDHPALNPTATFSTPAKDEELMNNLDIKVFADSTFRGVSICETGSSSAAIGAAWIVFGVTWGPATGLAAEVIITFLAANGNAMGPGTEFTLTNNARVAMAAPDGCGMVTVEGHLYGQGVIPTAAVITKGK